MDTKDLNRVPKLHLVTNGRNCKRCGVTKDYIISQSDQSHERTLEAFEHVVSNFQKYRLASCTPMDKKRINKCQ